MKLSNLKINKDPKAALSILLQLSLLVASLSYALLYPPKANAAITNLYVVLDRQSATATLGGYACLKTGTTSTTVNKIIVNFPSTFTLGALGGWSVDTSNAGQLTSFGATAWPTITGPTVVDDVASKAAIFSMTTPGLATGTLYCFHFTSGGNVGAAGNAEIGQLTTSIVTAGTTVNVDNGTYATSIVTGTNGEQVAVTASVSGTFTFALSPTVAIYGQTLPLGVLPTAANGVTAPNQIQASITTNAHNGYIAWIKSYNAKLHSAQVGSGSDLNSATVDLASGTGYGAFAYSTTADVATPYYTNGVGTHPTNGNGTTVGLLHTTQFDQIASETVAPIAAHTFNVGIRARATGTELPATDYSDTLTLVASGSF
jgi:hypothetical protein